MYTLTRAAVVFIGLVLSFFLRMFQMLDAWIELKWSGFSHRFDFVFPWITVKSESWGHVRSKGVLYTITRYTEKRRPIFGIVPIKKSVFYSYSVQWNNLHNHNEGYVTVRKVTTRKLVRIIDASANDIVLFLERHKTVRNKVEKI